ncbi:MAG: hypothetical protein A2015_11105 [Spirochaetes bacterium GWF1_31_7]|nr:MAG: hypothetical protein A2Y30_02340 [Spirochaetes bacterium GWE1_32_154]OHD46372.1 MAG: hypothetical protein A2Y29_04200 [Spirochaetes bacterium GWE2_31_10]OHD47751.1 MAG: hypothetical protein A2015_11105 [Spirochaetes bacterium GWF1_31_7]OHD81323.1 MAG: hypothetical protein A2355_10860 [Spirochaetes bacterium RIFOXYB1_FULL_32_8]HBD95599.1 class I SAM-dependent methyltransferase [Spirochaetia bacterium]
MEHHDFFNDNSDNYKIFRPAYPVEMFEYLSKISLDHSKAWDCACGNGQAATGLADYFENVYATDVSINQIAHSIVKKNIHYSVSISEKTSFEDSFFDIICVAQALHWFDYNVFWDEVKRVLKPGGIFAFWGYSWPSIDTKIDKEISDGVLTIIKPFWAEQNKILWSHYKDIEFPFKKLNAPQFELITEWNLNELYSYMMTWSATKKCIEVNSADFLEKSYSKMLKIWGNAEGKKQIKMDFCFTAGRK